MSEQMVSSTEPVYVRLLGEGTSVYRPAAAVHTAPGQALLVAPRSYDPEDEDWEFKPGTHVKLEARVLEGVQVLVAISAV
ncbi:MAG: hypothetical protein F9K16_05070 [Thermoanaerobaculia bacterium]|nr:MAG: hypothetical protein F9K16_05070 [Thermoanaerobaculia bacterium]MBZ0102685.1 hypothetical protein [Thermoanaerobaculia bacterium]